MAYIKSICLTLILLGNNNALDLNGMYMIVPEYQNIYFAYTCN